MLLCTVLTFAMCADPNVTGAISFDGLTVPIVWSTAQVRSCTDIGHLAGGKEPGLTRVTTAWSSQQDVETSSLISGRLVVRINDARIELTAYAWDHMTQAEVDALHRTYQATLWHELGHLRTAKATIDALNAEAPFSAPTAAEYTAIAKAHGNAAGVRINADQEAYDRAVDHGLRQDALPPPLGGANTVTLCTEGR